jgi:hypothetical protein
MRKLIFAIILCLSAAWLNAQDAFEVGTYNVATKQFTNETVNINGSFTFAIKVNDPSFQTVLSANQNRTLAYFEARYVLEDGDPENPTYLGEAGDLSLEARMTRVPGQFVYYTENYTPGVKLATETTGMIHFNVLVAEHNGDFWWVESNAAGAIPCYAGGIDFEVPDDGGVTTPGDLTGNKGNTKYWMHYMPWHSTNNGNWSNWHGGWNHWNKAENYSTNPNNIIGQRLNGAGNKRDIATHYYPLIDVYNGNDRDVLEYHCLLMKYAGVDGLKINWYGVSGMYDSPVSKESVDMLVQVAKEVGLEFSINYEDWTTGWGGNGNVNNAIRDLQYVQNNYFSMPNHIKIEGKPLLTTFGPRTITSEGDWNQIFNALNQKPFFMPLIGHEWAIGYSNANGIFNWRQDNHNNYRNEVQGMKYSYQHYIASVMPGYKDCYNGDGSPSTGSVGLETNGQFLKDRLAIAQSYDPPYIQLMTWNDYGESTMFEPTDEFGYTFLNILQEGVGLSEYKEVLPKIKEYFDQKKKYKGNTTEEARLKQAFNYFVAVQPENAIILLDGGNVGIEEGIEEVQQASIVGYYNILGQKLSQEPANGMFIIVYDNGTSEKVMK